MKQILQRILYVIRGGIVNTYRLVRYVLISFFETVWVLIFRQSVLPGTFPTLEVEKISVSETYKSWIKVSGVKRTEQFQPKGEIIVTIPFDKYKHLHATTLSVEHRFYSNIITEILSSAELGHLQILEFGNSNISKQFYLDLPSQSVLLNINTQEIEVPDMQKISRFDSLLAFEFYPETPNNLVHMHVEILDADADEDEKTLKKINDAEIEELEDVSNLLLDHIKHVDVNSELIIKFQLQVILPKTYALTRRIITADYMTLTWPLNLPHWKAELKTDKYQRINYYPEKGLIKWTNVNLRRIAPKQDANYIKYTSDLYRLKIKDPSEIYSNPKLTGHISITIDGLLSGLKLNLFPGGGSAIKERTIIETDYSLSLEDYFTQRNFYPKQHLYFPGVVLNNNRLADVFMLLRDEGFEIPYETWVQSNDDKINDKHLNKQISKFIIKAVKEEGTKELILWLILEGNTSETMRQREILGDNTYTTHLATGFITVDIWGFLQGDYKRVVNVINHIQIQLKEQFRHVSLAN